MTNEKKTCAAYGCQGENVGAVVVAKAPARLKELLGRLCAKCGRAEALNFLVAPRGACLGSKGQYRWDNEDNLVVFNANLLTKEDGKVWHGDLDITVSEEKIKAAAEALGVTLYVLREMDARFESETDPRWERAVYVARPDGTADLGGSERDYYGRSSQGRIAALPPPAVDPEEERRKLEERRAGYKRDAYQRAGVSFGDVSRYKGTKTLTPIEQFLHALARKMSRPKGKLLDTGALWLHSADYEALREATKAWVKKTHEGLTEYRLESEIGWLFFSIGPMHFEEGADPAFARRGAALLAKGRRWVKEEKEPADDVVRARAQASLA